jgi:hypothetical protein
MSGFQVREVGEIAFSSDRPLHRDQTIHPGGWLPTSRADQDIADAGLVEILENAAEAGQRD